MFTCDLTADQCRYLRRLVLQDLLSSQQLVRSPEIETYTSEAIVRVHEDIATANTLVAVIPEPRS